jgi:prepilin-type N-terminal cleavage/methylation domain-containing protein
VLKRSTHAGSSKGFTLIELVVVMVILAVTAVLVLPSVQGGMRQREVRRSLQGFVASVRRASSHATFERKHESVAVWPLEGKWSVGVPRQEFLYGEGDGTATTGKIFELPEFGRFEEVLGGRVVPGDVVLFDFYPAGGSSGGSVEILYDVGGEQQRWTLSIDPLLSDVRVEAPQG